MKFIKGKIISTGSYTPEKVLTNYDLEKMVDTSDEWILKRTGIKERKIACSDETASSMGIKAAKKALEKINYDPEKIDMIIVATNSMDMFFPATSCIIQDAIGAVNAGSYDLQYGCAGFTAALITAYQFLSSGLYKNILVIGTEAISKFIDWEDRNTCILFGDGAAAVLISSDISENSGLLSAYIKSDGSKKKLIELPGGGSKHPATIDTVKEKFHYIKMSGKEVFKIAVNELSNSSLDVMKNAGITQKEIDYFIFHQANLRIINHVGKKIKIDDSEKVLINIQKYGNTSAASVPIVIDEFSEKFKSGDNVLISAFGAGLASSACLIRW